MNSHVLNSAGISRNYDIPSQGEFHGTHNDRIFLSVSAIKNDAKLEYTGRIFKSLLLLLSIIFFLSDTKRTIIISSFARCA